LEYAGTEVDVVLYSKRVINCCDLGFHGKGIEPALARM